MKKKLIIVIGIIIVLILGGIIGSKTFASGDLQVPNKLELKAQYKNDVSIMYPENFKQITLCAIKLYKNIYNITIIDVQEYSSLSKKLQEGKDGTTMTATERLLLGKINDVNEDLISSCAEKKSATKVKLKQDIQAVLDCYK